MERRGFGIVAFEEVLIVEVDDFYEGLSLEWDKDVDGSLLGDPNAFSDMVLGLMNLTGIIIVSESIFSIPIAFFFLVLNCIINFSLLTNYFSLFRLQLANPAIICK